MGAWFKLLSGQALLINGTLGKGRYFLNVSLFILNSFGLIPRNSASEKFISKKIFSNLLLDVQESGAWHSRLMAW
jgi:hypothetical protein